MEDTSPWFGKHPSGALAAMVPCAHEQCDVHYIFFVPEGVSEADIGLTKDWLEHYPAQIVPKPEDMTLESLEENLAMYLSEIGWTITESRD